MNTQPRPRAAVRILFALALLAGLAGAECRLPGQRSTEIQADKPTALIERCAQTVRGMHFEVKAIDRSHLIVVAEGKVEGNLVFHPVRLSIKVVHMEGTRYRVEVTATGDERGIRAGAEKKAREMFFRELEGGGRAG